MKLELYDNGISYSYLKFEKSLRKWNKHMHYTVVTLFLYTRGHIWPKQNPLAFTLISLFECIFAIYHYPCHIKCACDYKAQACVQTHNTTCWMWCATRSHELCSSYGPSLSIMSNCMVETSPAQPSPPLHT